MKLSQAATEQVASLRRHYLAKHRPEAVRNLTKALQIATQKIAANKSLPFPRPYPNLAREGIAWTHAGRYWIAHTIAKPVVIIAVYYDSADIPSRSP